MADEEYNYKKGQYQHLFNLLQDWIVACVVDANSDRLEDRIHRNRLRDDIIERLVTREFDL